MKKILSLLGAITLIGTSKINLVACNKPQYNKEELKIWKENKKINTANQEIKNNLEPISYKEKPFDNVDNKYYYVVWRGDKKKDWRIIKFKNNVTLFSNKMSIKLDGLNNRDLFLKIYNFKPTIINLYIYEEKFIPFKEWWNESTNYFKSVYRWNSNTLEPNLIVDKNGVIKVN